MLNSLRRFLVVGGLVAAAAAPLALLAGTAGAATSGHAAVARTAVATRSAVPDCTPNPFTGICESPIVTGYGEAPAGLNIRTGPGTGYSVAGVIPYTASVTVWCYHTGDYVYNDNYWDYITGPYGQGYVSDYWLLTYGNINDQVDGCLDGLT